MAHDPSTPHRRQFLQRAGLGAAAAPGQLLASAEQKKPDGNPIPLRPFGRHDARVSALGFGGHHLGDYKTVEDATKAVHEAIDGGVTFFDNCWEYWNGRAE